VKNWILATMVTLQAVFQPAQSMLLTVLVLIVCDLITGVLAARKRGESIKSAGIGRTIVKLVIYELAIGLSFLAETYLMGPLIPASKIAASLIGTTELLSVLENLNTLSGGDLLKSIIDKLTSLGKQ
jgi:phage-related holin